MQCEKFLVTLWWIGFRHLLPLYRVSTRTRRSRSPAQPQTPVPARGRRSQSPDERCPAGTRGRRRIAPEETATYRTTLPPLACATPASARRKKAIPAAPRRVAWDAAARPAEYPPT